MFFTKPKGILSNSNGMNIYRGCTHGCIYCDARSTCYQMNHKFENIEVKINAPELLDLSLSKKRKPCMVGTGAMSDPYMHCEKDLLLTQKCIKVINKYNCGLAIQTKSDLIMRDIDLLEEINKKSKCVVQMTLTTADEKLCKIVEPNVCTTKRRFEVLLEMKKRKIPTVAWLTPFLPFINGTLDNLKLLFEMCLEANVKGIIMFNAGLTLRDGDRQYFYMKLDQHFPGLKEKYIRTFDESYEIPCEDSIKMLQYKESICSKNKIITDMEVFDFLHRFDEKPQPVQYNLF